MNYQSQEMKTEPTNHKNHKEKRVLKHLKTKPEPTHTKRGFDQELEPVFVQKWFSTKGFV
jgi:hypothetical protein